jgi:hypothetical protein
MMAKRAPIEAPNRVRLADPLGDGLASSVRRPLRIQFEPPAGPTAWRMTGRFNWPCPPQNYGIVPTCEWANDEGLRIWLPAQHKDLVAEFSYRVEGRWRKLARRSRRLLQLAAAIPVLRAEAEGRIEASPFDPTTRNVMKSIHWLVLLAVLIPVGASAQMSDADYCKALTQKYEVYISNISVGRSPTPGAIDGTIAIDKCKSGNTAAGIPVLEKKLRDAKVDLPPRG